jgi:ATP-dependent protease Clp ATPase subunit
VLRHLEPEDLLKFGLIPEFVGRLPVIATLEDLDEVALMEILSAPKNALVKQYQRLFEMEDVKLTIPERRSRASPRRPSSARPAPAACARSWKGILLDTMFELPGLRERPGGGDLQGGRGGRCQAAAHLFGPRRQGLRGKAEGGLDHRLSGRAQGT